MNREKCDRLCERGILGLVLAILVFGPLATGAVDTWTFLVLQGLTIPVLLLWIIRFWAQPRPELLWPPITWAVLAFMIYAVLRYRAADIEYVARLEMIRVLVYGFLFLAIVNNLHRKEHTQLIVFTLVFLAMAISSYGIYQFATGSDKVWTFTKPYPHRASGTYICPNHLAGFLEMILPLGLAWTLVSRAKPLLRVFLGYASLVILTGIAFTVSRGSWLSVALVLIVFFFVLSLHPGYRLISALLLVVILGSSAFFIPQFRTLTIRWHQGATAHGNINEDLRISLWQPALAMWKDNLWWGVGPDHFNYRFRAYRPENVQLEPEYVHNDYLNTGADWGIVGSAIVAGALVLLAAGVRKTWRYVRGTPSDLSTKQSNKFALVLGASLGLLAIALHSVVDFNMHIPANAILAVTLIAILSGCLRFATEKYWFSAGIPVKIAATLLLGSGAVYLIQQEIKRAGEFAWTEQARLAAAFSPEEMSALEKAMAVEPMNFQNAYVIGEILRLQSWQGDDDYAETASKAMQWFGRAIQLNRFHGSSYMRYGMCLDWVGRAQEARTYFARAIELDPNGYFINAHMGWHYVQEQDYAAAREWLQRSLRLQPTYNPIASSYLPIVKRKLLEGASEPVDTIAPND